MICCFPYGAVVVTALYFIFNALVVLSQLRRCERENDEDCGICGTGGFVRMWMTYSFNSIIIACMSIHLIVYRQCYRPCNSGRSVSLLGSFALACMSLAFIIESLVSLFDTKCDDEEGGRGNYTSKATFYLLMSLSSILLEILFHLSPKRRRMMATYFVVLNVAATILIVSVCVMLAASRSNINLEKSIVDDTAEVMHKDLFLLQLLRIGEGLWNACYCLFLLTIAIVWGSIAKQNVVFVMGLPNSLAGFRMKTEK